MEYEKREEQSNFIVERYGKHHVGQVTKLREQ
jgi:hypothetical protein